jgi:hypothetical protein
MDIDTLWEDIKGFLGLAGNPSYDQIFSLGWLQDRISTKTFLHVSPAGPTPKYMYVALLLGTMDIAPDTCRSE